jgi:hypothetical protein
MYWKLEAYCSIQNYRKSAEILELPFLYLSYAKAGACSCTVSLVRLTFAAHSP